MNEQPRSDSTLIRRSSLRGKQPILTVHAFLSWLARPVSLVSRGGITRFPFFPWLMERRGRPCRGARDAGGLDWNLQFEMGIHG